MGNKNGWGEARPGKVVTGQDTPIHDKDTNPKSSKDLNGLYDKWQGNRQGTKGK